MSISSGSAAFQAIVKQIFNAAKAEEPVLIVGEVGTGKRQAAVSIHRASRRRDARFLVLNCLGLAHNRFEEELLGCISENFELNRKGALSLSEGGTLYLHEVAELSLESQALLMRFMETGTYSPLKGSELVRSNVRIISSTSVRLENLVEVGRFRNDLYHHLCTITIHTPTLNDRYEDIPMLAKAMLNELGFQGRKYFAEDALTPLLEHSFNGNLIELKNILFRALHNSDAEEVTSADMRFALRSDLSYQNVHASAIASNSMEARYLGFDHAEDGRSSAKSVDGRRDERSSAIRAGQDRYKQATDDEFAHLNSPIKLESLSDSNVTPSSANVTDENEVETAAVESESRSSRSGRNQATIRAAKAAMPSLKEQERQYFLQLLETCGGDKRKVAKIAGLNLRTLYRKLASFDDMGDLS